MKLDSSDLLKYGNEQKECHMVILGTREVVLL